MIFFDFDKQLKKKVLKPHPFSTEFFTSLNSFLMKLFHKTYVYNGVLHVNKFDINNMIIFGRTKNRVG